MTKLKLILISLTIILLSSCASKYNLITPRAINYRSLDEDNGVTLAYRYDLLRKKYAKKENKRGIKLIAIKIVNKTEKDLTFGKDIKLSYENGNDIFIMDNNALFKSLKQSPASYLFYLLLTPLNLYTTTSTNSYNSYQETTNSKPIGLILGPGLAGSNMITAGSANKKFKTELLTYDLFGTVIKKGETAYGLIGIHSDTHDALKLKVE